MESGIAIWILALRTSGSYPHLPEKPPVRCPAYAGPNTYFTPEVEELEGMGERNDVERRRGNMASLVTIKVEENRTIQPILVNTNEDPGEIVQRAYFSRDAS